MIKQPSSILPANICVMKKVFAQTPWNQNTFVYSVSKCFIKMPLKPVKMSTKAENFDIGYEGALSNGVMAEKKN